jgi:hypothetical protein
MNQVFKNVVKILFLLDLLLIALHLVWGQKIPLVNLDLEHNLPTIYQGFKAILIGLFLMKSMQFRFLGGLITYIGLDEILIIHERTEGFFRKIFPKITTFILSNAKSLGYGSVTWMLLLSPILFLLAMYGLRLLNRLTEKKKNILMLSMLFFGVSFIAEFVNTQSSIPLNIYHQLVAIEEACELLGMTNLVRLIPLISRSKF